MKPLHLIVVSLLASAGGLATGTATPGVARADSAEGASAAKQPVARRLYEEGVEAAGKAHWPIAYDRFKASYEVAPRVVTLYNLASAQAHTGRLIEASESYRKFLRETGDGRYPELRADALSQLERVTKQVAQITLDVADLAASDSVTIDDIEFPQAALHEPVPLNPGPHTVVVHRGDAALATRDVTLAPGASEPVKLELPLPAAPAPRDPVKPVDLSVHPDTHPGAPAATGVVLDTHPAPPPRRSVLRSPWLWSAAAVVVAGSVTAAYLLTRSDGDVLVVR